MRGQFGATPFGATPFGSIVRDPPRIYMFGRATLSIDFDFRIFAASREFITESDDIPANQPFGGSLDQPLSFRRSIIQSDGIGGFVIGQGQLVIQNASGEYDFLPQRYALDGRDVEVRFGRVGRGVPYDPYEDWFVVFRGTAADMHVDEQELTVTLQDDSFKLEVPLQTSTYSGDGGIEGTADLAGKPKPLVFGSVLNITPPLVVPNSYLYQVHDGAVEAIAAVYSRGVALIAGDNYATSALLLAASTASGEFDTCLAEGMFRVNFVLEGEITADVDGDSAGSFAETKADIIRRILARSTELDDPDDLYMPAFTAYQTAQPGAIGLYFDHNSSDLVYDAIAKVIGQGAWAGFRRDGRFEVKQFDRPTGVPAARFDKRDIRDNIRRERLPSGISPAPWRWKVPYQKNWTVIEQPADSVSAALRSFLAAEFRYATAEAETVKVDHPLAQERTVEAAAYRDEADAAAEADRLLDLYRRPGALYRMLLGTEAMKLGIGQVIEVTYPRFDLTVGRLLAIVEISEDARERTVEIVGYG